METKIVMTSPPTIEGSEDIDFNGYGNFLKVVGYNNNNKPLMLNVDVEQEGGRYKIIKLRI